MQIKVGNTEMVSKSKDAQVAFLQAQIKLRDGVIQDWRSALQEGKVKSKIQYSNLKNIEEVAESAKLNVVTTTTTTTTHTNHKPSSPLIQRSLH